jgi:hypothetical protein
MLDVIIVVVVWCEAIGAGESDAFAWRRLLADAQQDAGVLVQAVLVGAALRVHRGVVGNVWQW